MHNVTNFKLNALSIALGLVSFSSISYGAEVIHSCSLATDCYYSTSTTAYQNLDTGEQRVERFWSIRGSKLGGNNDDLKASVVAQHYQNLPATRVLSYQDTTDLMGISNSTHYDFVQDELLRKASLFVPKGTTATLSRSSGQAHILSLYNADAVVESGVVFTIEPTYDEMEGVSEFRFFNGAIRATGQSNVETSADIIINAKEAEALSIGNKATLIAHNHNITLNAAMNGAANIYDKAQATFDKVNIIGTKENQIGLDLSGNSTYALFKNGTIDLKASEGMAVATSSGNVDVKNSQINASYAIHTDAFGYPDARDYSANNTKINIVDSKVNGQKLFVGVNLEADGATPKSNNYITAVNVDNSQVSGGIASVIYEDDLDMWTTNVDADTNVFLTLKDSQWTVNRDSQLNTLTMSNSTVALQPVPTFQTLTITNDLAGEGHFELNTDLANQKADKIVVKGQDSGSFTLGIQDSKNEPKSANGKVTLVETPTGMAQFSLKDRDYVDAGAYRYRLNKEGTNWVLANRQSELVADQPVMPSKPNPQPDTPELAKPAVPAQPVTPAPAKPAQPVAPGVARPAVPTPPVVSVTPSVPVAPSVIDLSEMSNALISLRQAQGLLLTQNLQGIHQRLGELRTGHSSNVWVKNQNGQIKAKSQSVSAESRSSGFKQDYHNLQIGADYAVNDIFRFGGFVGTSRADIDFNGEYNKGKLRSQAVGLYGTFANSNGWYIDNIVKYERLKSTATSIDSRNYNGFTFSTELGKRMELSSLWTITPQAQLAYTTIAGKNDEDRLSLFTARAGVRVAKGFSLNNGWSITPYAEINAIAEKTNNSQVRVNQYAFDVPKNKGRLHTAFGVSAGNSSHRLGLEVGHTSGKQVKQPLALQANYRYQW